MAKGAVVAVSYTVNYFVKYNRIKTRITDASNYNMSDYKYDLATGTDTMQDNVNKMSGNFKYDDYGVGDETVGKARWMDAIWIHGMVQKHNFAH